MRSLQTSVVIPTFNRADLVCRAVESVLAAIASDDEIIVVDDGSSDDTIQRLAQFGDRVRLIATSHRGAGGARNEGIRASTKPLVAFLDSDDTWMPHKLVLQRAVMQSRPDVLFCFSDFVSREAGGDHRRQLHSWHQDARSWDDILGPAIEFSSIATLPPDHADFNVHIGDLYLAEMQRDYVATFTMIVRREDAGSALRFAEDVKTFEDWECFARLARAGKAAYLDCETAWQYGHAGPRLTDAAALDRVESRLCILKRIWGTDNEFLRRHEREYREVCSKYYRGLVAARLRRGQSRLARADLLSASAPWMLRALAMLPGPIAQALLACRDMFYNV